MAIPLRASPTIEILGYEFQGPLANPERLPHAAGLLALVDVSGYGDTTIHGIGCTDDLQAMALDPRTCKTSQTPRCCLMYAFLDSRDRDLGWRIGTSEELLRGLGL